MSTNRPNGKTLVSNISSSNHRSTRGCADSSTNSKDLIPASRRNGDGSTRGGGYGGKESRRRGQIDPRFAVRRDPAQPRRGRGVFALEKVPAGTEVLVAKQAAAIPRDRYRAAFCRRCLTLLDKKSLIKCRRCEDRFCGKECVIAHAGESTHEATCAFVEGLGEEHLESLGRGASTAVTDGEILRLTLECFARRSAGLSDQDEWVEIEDLDLGPVSVGENDGLQPEIGMLGPDVVRMAEARLNARGLVATAEEIQTVNRR